MERELIPIRYLYFLKASDSAAEWIVFPDELASFFDMIRNAENLGEKCFLKCYAQVVERSRMVVG
jgi:hypothetical protein